MRKRASFVGVAACSCCGECNVVAGPHLLILIFKQVLLGFCPPGSDDVFANLIQSRYDRRLALGNEYEVYTVTGSVTSVLEIRRSDSGKSRNSLSESFVLSISTSVPVTLAVLVRSAV